MKQNSSPFGLLIFIVILGLGAAVAYATNGLAANLGVAWIGVVAFVLALVVSSAIQVANQWDRVVILRLGQFHALTAVESMQLGGMAGLTALTMGLGQEQRANGQKAPELAS